MIDTLIYDVGAHLGADTEFYLKKGFSVVAIEAAPQLCDYLFEKFAECVRSGQLKILNLAIADEPGAVDFYMDQEKLDWGTTQLAWVARNKSLGGGEITKIRVAACLLSDIMKEHGVPRYCKIDIEGNDLSALKSLRQIEAVPHFISIESEKTSWEKLMEEFAVFNELGYRRFKIMDQMLVNLQRCPDPALEGGSCEHAFEVGNSSGLFGEELPGRWLDSFEALEQYKNIFRGYALNGHNGLFSTKRDLFYLLGRIQAKIAHLRGSTTYIHPAFNLPPDGWYDTHAAL